MLHVSAALDNSTKVAKAITPKPIETEMKIDALSNKRSTIRLASCDYSISSVGTDFIPSTEPRAGFRRLTRLMQIIWLIRDQPCRRSHGTRYQI